MSTPTFRLTPLPAAFVTRVRTTLRDDFNRPVGVTVAEGGEPLRDQLRRAAPGERIILCSYQAVPLPSLFAEVGPIFISAEAAPAPGSAAGAMPAAGYFNRPFALRAYDAADAIIESALTEPADAPGRLAAWLANPAVACVHARFGGHGCFAARFDRA